MPFTANPPAMRDPAPRQGLFEHVVAALVHGSGYERIASPGCSDRTIRRRLAEWAELSLAEAPCGGERPGPWPVDRRKGGC